MTFINTEYTNFVSNYVILLVVLVTLVGLRWFILTN